MNNSDVINKIYLKNPREKELLSKERNDYIMKSVDMVQRTRYSLSLQEQKILLYVLSKVTPGDTKQTSYTFEIKRFCEVCGNGSSNYGYIKEILENMRQKTFWISAPGEKVNAIGESCVAWFSTIRMFSNNGQVELRFDPDLLPYIIEIRSHFVTYPLFPILAMKSKYSVRLYEMLESYSNLDEWTFMLDNLKKKLDAELYIRYQDFRRKVIETSLREINELTHLTIEYEAIKIGREFKKITFFIHHKSNKQKLQANQEVKKNLDETQK